MLAIGTPAFGDTLTSLYSFGGVPDGSQPASGTLVADASGTLFGTTGSGGANGCGTVFKLARPNRQHATWTETVLLSFDCGAGGSQPASGLSIDAAGNLFGTTFSGGAANAGTVFKLVPGSGRAPWSETVLWNFDGMSGANPAGAPIRDKSGNLFGTAETGGVSNAGTVYELSPPAGGKGAWTETTLASFDGADNGSQPIGSLVFDTAGNLYGTTSTGGSGAGIVYQLSPPGENQTAWSETVLLAMNASDTGANPVAGLTIDAQGNLYGTAKNGGPNNLGTVFELISAAPSRRDNRLIASLLYAFNGGDGENPQGNLVLDKKGAVYGTAAGGGTANAGVIFEVSPPTRKHPYWIGTTLAALPGMPGGAAPAGGLLRTRSGTFYGMTGLGGTANVGTIYSLAP